MKKHLFILLFLIAAFSTTFTATAEKSGKGKSPYISSKVKKALNMEISCTFKGYELDTCIAICKDLANITILFDKTASKMKMPKVTYVARRYKLRKVLNDITKGTDFVWTLKGPKIMIGKRQI